MTGATIHYQPGHIVKQAQPNAEAKRIINLSANECPFPPSMKVIQAIQQNMNDLTRYPDDELPRFKERLAQHNQVTANQIAFGAGSGAIIEKIIGLFSCPGDSIVMSEHSFLLYRLLASAYGANILFTKEKGFHQDLDLMLKAITKQTKIIFLSNPSNPGGTWLTLNDLTQFIRKCPSRITIVVDEAYHEFMHQKDYSTAVPLVNKHPNLIVLRTFSKAYGLAGLRFGYSISSETRTQMIKRTNTSSVSRMALVAAEAIIEDKPYMKMVLENSLNGMKLLQTAFNKLGLKSISNAGNFLTINFGKNTSEINDLFLQKGIVLKKLTTYKMPHFLRITIGTNEENQIFITCLNEIITSK
jgi:histidinol-phosphate aminotransferase